jgi:hypothetical protein
MHQVILPVVGLLLSITVIQIYRDIRKVQTWQAPTNETPLGIADNLQSFDCEVSHPINQVTDVGSGIEHFIEQIGHFFHIS